jgi:hypothetical protein
MSTMKISGLPSATTVSTADEVVLNQDGVTKRASISLFSSGSVTTSPFAPVEIDDDTTFVVPDNSQVIMAMPISVDGILQVDGFLIEL